MKVTWVNGNVIMSGCEDDNPDDERLEAARNNREIVSRRGDGGVSSAGAGSQLTAKLPDQGTQVTQSLILDSVLTC